MSKKAKSAPDAIEAYAPAPEVPEAAVVVPVEPEAPAAQAQASLPASIQLVRPHSFIDDNEVHRMWAQGQVVTDAVEIELLIARKAEYI